MSRPRLRNENSEFPEQGVPGVAKITLPPTPSMLGRETGLENAPVVAHQLRGEPLEGVLHNLDQADGEVTLGLRDGSPAVIRFDDLRFLLFSHPLLPPAQQTAATGIPDAAKAFVLRFVDGKVLHGIAEAVIIEPFGFNIFLHKPDGHLYRIYAPKRTIREYDFEIPADEGNTGESMDGVARQTQQHHTSPSSAANSKNAADAAFTAPSSRGTDPPPATCTSELIENLSRTWTLPSEHLGDLLLARGVITEDQLHNVLSLLRQNPDEKLGAVLVSRGLAAPEQVAAALAFKLGLPFVKLDSFDIDSGVLIYFPRDLAIRLHLIPLFVHKDRLVVAMADPTNSDASRMVEFISQHRVEVAVAVQADVDAAIDQHYRRHEDDEVIEQFGEITEPDDEIEQGSLKEAERLGKEKTIVRLVQNMIIEAVHRKASDIHIRPGESSVEVILRIDGTLVGMRNITKSVHAAVVSRVKIIGRMDISERRIPQDGRASIKLHGDKIDLRISVMPTINGESVVIRILDTLAGLKRVDQLGFAPRDHQLFKDLISHSYGILLVTGPTGSGKSTTLYAALEHIRKSNVNIITAEDPVEYHIAGIEQMQVNHKIDYSFARILRNILRHDPDVIMVGEIRDQETAKVAIESALTGHLVLSTLHTNSAAVTITRLLEMGVEPYLINDTLLGVLAQRLVRKNCPHCIAEEEVDASVYTALGISGRETFFRGRGCDNCNHTGYKGRMAVYELLQMNQSIRQSVLSGVSADIIHEQAVAGGMSPLTQNALNAAREKKTSLAEVYRVRLE